MFAEGNGKQKSKGKALIYTVFQNFVTSVNFVNLRWLNTVLRAVSGTMRDGARFKLEKQTRRRITILPAFVVC